VYTRKHKSRLLYVLLVIAISFLALTARLFYIQTFASGKLSAIAKNQYETVIELKPQRGIIFDRKMKPLATNITVYSVFAEAKRIKQKQEVARAISSTLGIDEKYVLDKLSKDKYFVWIDRKVPDEKAKKLKELNLKGIGFEKEAQRTYPNGKLASNIIGFVDIDNKGLEGLEGMYDPYIRGQSGYRFIQRDAKRRILPNFESRYIPPIDGNHVVLTIDEVVQYIVEKQIDNICDKYNAKGAMIIVMDPYTGDILALANRPTYDPNNVKHSAPADRRDRAVTDTFEPGSVFKIVTASAALESKLVKPEDKFFCENGEYKYSTHILHDHRPHGWLTFKEVIEMSSNIGTCKVAQIVGPNRLYKYIKAYGIGDLTKIDLPGEVRGYIRPPSKWSKLSITSVPMGQEVTVNSIQLACAVSAIANGGTLMKPRIVRAVVDKDGAIIKEYPVQRVRKVITNETAKEMRSFLRGVVTDGTGQMAESEGYYPAGKTGTGQKLEPTGVYSHSKFTSSFIGFVPYDKPLFTIVVIVDEPHPLYFGGTVAAPAFKNIATDIMRYKGMPKREILEAKKPVSTSERDD